MVEKVSSRKAFTIFFGLNRPTKTCRQPFGTHLLLGDLDGRPEHVPHHRLVEGGRGQGAGVVPVGHVLCKE